MPRTRSGKSNTTQHHAMLVVDIECSSGRGSPAQSRIRAALWDALAGAVRRSGTDPAACLRKDDGDGYRLIFPQGTAKSTLIYPLLHDLAARLTAHNAAAGGLTVIRVRAALHAGDVRLDRAGQPEGRALELLARLLEAPPLRAALREAPPHLPVAALLSPHFHEEAVQPGIAGVDVAAFRSIPFTTKEYTGNAWLFLPGAPAPEPGIRVPVARRTGEGGPGSGPSTEPAAVEPGSAGSRMVNRADDGAVVFGVQGGNQYVNHDPGNTGRAPMDEELAALAAAGAATMVTAMATDAWSAVREAIAGLFHRVEERRRGALERQLDGNAEFVRHAADPHQAREALRGMWTLEFVALAREDPECRIALTRLIVEAGRAGRGGSDGAADPAATSVQENHATGSSTVFAVQHGDQHVRTTKPGSAADVG